jgi:murein DD-endopeptidase MepM/ murein hydrolase activator NlpD
MKNNPDNVQANSELASAFPGKNVNFSAHLANALPSDPQGVATGSANLTMGNTGHSTGTHVHNQGVDTTGKPTDYLQLMELIKNRMYR